MNQPSIIQNIAMKAAIVRDGKILLLRESSRHDTNTKAGKYQFPGGRLDPGEPFLDGLKREVMEETGMEVEVGEPLYVGEWFPVIKGVPHQIVAMFMVCTPKSAQVILSEEHDAYEWVAAHGNQQIEIMAPDDKVVELYFERYK